MSFPGPSNASVAELFINARKQLQASISAAERALCDEIELYTRNIQEVTCEANSCARVSATAAMDAIAERHAVGPPIAVGPTALAEIADYFGDDVVFHGTRSPIPTLEPRQSHWKTGEGVKVPDGDPAICATTDADVSHFRALVKGRIRGGDYFTAADGQTIFRVPKSDLPALADPEATGYVHVLSRAAFDRSELPCRRAAKAPNRAALGPQNYGHIPPSMPSVSSRSRQNTSRTA